MMSWHKWHGPYRTAGLAIGITWWNFSTRQRPTRAGNRLDVVHVNEVKGGIEATAHLLEV